MFDKLNHHADLMKTMSREAGLDLGQDIERGRLSATDYRAAVLTCTRCRHVGECEAFLSKTPGSPRAVPDYCLNKDLLLGLAEK